jgi:outer membrane murein-binding lipoprotein Lpp
MANNDSNTITSKTISELRLQIKQLKRTEELLRQDNKALMNDNTRLRKEKDIWMKKSHENLRLSFNKGG